MRNKRVVLALVAIVGGMGASLFLANSLGSTQSTSGALSAYAQQEADLYSPAGLLAIQAVSVTFPSGPWPSYAHDGISVHPEPPVPGHPTELCAVVINEHSTDLFTATIEFGVADFGIGVPFAPVGQTDVVVPPGGEAIGCVVWVPPEPGRWSIQARLMLDGFEDQFAQRNLDVDEPLQLDVPHSRYFLVGNLVTDSATITLGFTSHLVNWEISLSEDTLTDVSLGEQRPVTLTVTPRDGLPPGWEPIVDVEAYIDGELIGGLRKIFRPPILLHRFPDPPYAEGEISVHPYPPRAGEPTEICVELHNPTASLQEATVFFSWAEFGIGLPFHPINGPRPVALPPHSIINECIHWIPPIDGSMCLQVELEMDGYTPQQSQRNIDVDEPLEPGVPHSRPFLVGNPLDHPVTITLGLIPHLPDWGLELSQDVIPNVPSGGDSVVVTLTVTPPADLPGDQDPIVDVEAYAEGELIGGFRKVFRPPVPIHQPQDPIYAESEIFVHPYPPRAREPTEVGVEVRNPTDEEQTITVTFSFAPFGIGLHFERINEPITVTVPPNGLVRPATMWIPPDEGLWCFQVEIELPDHDEPFYSQRNIDVGEPLEPNEPHSRPFIVRNPSEEDTVTITLGLIPHFPNWVLELSHDVLPNVEPGGERVVLLTVTPPDDLPEDGDPIVDVEAYIEGELLGGFRKIFRPPVPIHRPKDPIYAESEIGVDPYPVVPGHPVELSVEVFNPTEDDRIVTATFSIAPFGIGLPFTTTHITPNPIQIFVPAMGAARGHVIWHPPDWHGKFCVQVTLEMEGHELIWSRRNIDVGEPLDQGTGHSLDFSVGGWPHTETVTVALGLVNHRAEWDVSLSQNTTTVDPGQAVTMTLTVTPSAEAHLGTGDPIVDVEAYVEGELLGGFRKLDIPPIPIHKPHEKGYAESEISINPYPPQQGQPTQVSAVVQNTSDTTTTVNLEFGWAKFGLGIPFSTTGMAPYTASVTLAPHVTETVAVTWTPSRSGHQCVRILLSDPDGKYEPQESQRNVDVAERTFCGTNVYTFTVRNDSPNTATVDIGLITFDVPTNWEVTVVPSDTLELCAGCEGVITITVKIPCPSTVQAMHALQAMYTLQEGAGGAPTVDVEGYVNGKLIGGIELQFEGQVEWPSTIYLPLILKGW